MKLLNTLSATTLSLALATTGCGKTAPESGSQRGAIDIGHKSSQSILLTWDARTGAAAESFNIYGSTSLTAAEVPLATVAATAVGFDPKHPSFTLLTSAKELQPFAGNTLCLSVSAVVAGIESGYSNLECNSLLP